MTRICNTMTPVFGHTSCWILWDTHPSSRMSFLLSKLVYLPRLQPAYRAAFVPGCIRHVFREYQTSSSPISSRAHTPTTLSEHNGRQDHTSKRTSRTQATTDLPARRSVQLSTYLSTTEILNHRATKPNSSQLRRPNKRSR